MNRPGPFLLAAAFVVASANLVFADLQVYISKPQAQAVDSTFAGVMTEDFNSSATGTFTTLPSKTIGTYTNVVAGKGKILANDQYGGYMQGNYLAVPPGGQVSVTLNSPASYFGMFFTAADTTDTITVYDTLSNVLGQFSTLQLSNFLSTPTVTATNGTVYDSGAYKGQPTVDGSAPTKNTGEYYSYLNFVALGGSSIGRVDFSKSSGGSFESDNHSVSATAPSFANSSFVLLGTATPEPGSVAMLLAGALLLGVTAIGRRRASL